MTMGRLLSEWKASIAVLVIGMALSMLACSYVREWEEAQYFKEVAFRSESRLLALEGTVQSTFRTIHNVRSAIGQALLSGSSSELNEQAFDAIVESFIPEEDRAALRNVAWIPRSATADKRGYRYHVLYSRFDSVFGIKPGMDASKIQTHERHIREVAESGESLIDMHRDRDSHQIVSMFVPLFAQPEKLGEAFLIGIVYAEWDVGVLLEAASESMPISGLDFLLYDIEEDGAQSLIYSHHSRLSSSSERSNMEPVWFGEITVAEHQWKLTAAPSPGFQRAHPVVLAWIIIAIGSLISLAAALYVWRVAVRGSLIEHEVELRTAELLRSQKSLVETQRIAHLGGWEWNIQSGELEWSDEVYRVFGYTPGEFKPTYERLLELVHPDDRARVVENINGALSGKQYSIVHRVILPDGSIRAVHEQARLELDKQGDPVRMVGTVQDITEQRRAERRLHRLAMALAETAESVVITNENGVIRYVNKAFEAMSGYAAEEVLGKTPNMVKSGMHSDDYYKVMWKTVSSGKSWFGTFTNRNKSGELYEVEQTISPIHDMYGEITGYVAVQRDVTGEREQREKMEHTQRLESLGILAGGIAHDFNNLLTAIMGNATLAKGKKDIEEVEEHLNRIEMTSERAAELCRQMLAYSGQGDYVREWFDLNHRIYDMVELLQVSLSKRAKLDIDLQAVACEVHADKSQIQQVVMNLVINASEAIEETERSGKIVLTTECLEMNGNDFEQCLHHESVVPESGDYFCLTVSDNGCGMNEETRVKLFDPFFTTKFTGRGLGTSAMLGIVKAHHGALSVETEIDVGTTFRVYLPCRQAEDASVESTVDPANVRSTKKSDRAPSLQGLSVLLVDDESFVLDIISKMLESFGCDVEKALNGHDAVEFYREHGDEISLAIVDMTMPDMDGLSCAEKLLELDPQASIILSSGYSEDLLAERTEGVAISGFLQKPYSSNQLYDLLIQLLSDKSS